MYKDLTAQLRLFETVCRHSEKPDIADLVRCAWKAIEELSSAGSIYGKAWTLGYDAGRDENMPRWIPVTERLPDEYVSVLCYCSRNDQYGCGEWRKEDNGTIYWAGLYGMIPTHWMPLPSAPTEE